MLWENKLAQIPVCIGTLNGNLAPGGNECAKRKTCDCCFSTQFSDLPNFSSACKRMNMLLMMWAGR